jgi:hypothetical protein
MALACDFENNGPCGINLVNEGRILSCRASTHGGQPYLVNAFLNRGAILLDACRTEGYGGFEGKMKLAKVGGSGTVTMRTCGGRSDLDLSGHIDVKAS